MRANKECKARITREIEARKSTIASLQMKLQKVTEELKIVKLKGNPYQAPDHLFNRSILYIFYSIKQEIRSFGKWMVPPTREIQFVWRNWSRVTDKKHLLHEARILLTLSSHRYIPLLWCVAIRTNVSDISLHCQWKINSITRGITQLHRGAGEKQWLNFIRKSMHLATSTIVAICIMM